MKTKKIRMVVDAAMTAALPGLMAYSLIGETLHEIADIAMLRKKTLCGGKVWRAIPEN